MRLYWRSMTKTQPMKTYKLLMFIMSFSLLACQNGQNKQNNEDEKPLKTESDSLVTSNELIDTRKVNNESTDVLELNGTVWTNVPMEEFPNCIDSLQFEENQVYVYSCEHEYGENHKYELKSDSIYVEKWDIINEADSTKELSAKEWYKLTDDGLVWVKIQRKRGDYWDDLDSQYLNKFYHKKVK